MPPAATPAWLDAVPVAVRADVIVTLLGAAGAAAYLAHVARAPRRSALEARGRWLVTALFALCLLRAGVWLAPNALLLHGLAFVPAALLPLAMTLFVEGLLRRHVPRPVKLLALGVTVAAFVVNAARPLLGPALTSVLLGPAFAAAELLVLAVLALVLLRRDRRTLSRAENRVVGALLGVATLSLPLVASDYRTVLGWPANRMGGLAVLLLLHTLLRTPRAREAPARWAWDVGRLVLTAAVATALVVLLVGAPSVAMLTHLGSVILGVALLGAVGMRLRDLAARRRGAELLDWLAAPPPATLDEYARALRRLPLAADAVLVGEVELRAYHADAVREAFAAHGRVLSHGAVQALAAAGGPQARGAEELADLLERHEATHAGLLGERPLRLLLAAVPELPGAAEAETELLAVLRRGEHALALEALAAAGAEPALAAPSPAAGARA